MQAVAFDGFPIFDPRPVFGRAHDVVGARAPAFIEAWRGRLFQYQWLRALGGRYADFLAVNDDALRFAARATDTSLTAGQHAELAGGFRELTAWPDAKAALTALREQGLRLAFLSNMTAGMLRAGIERAELTGLFDHVLSTDAIRTYKPNPAAYQLGVDAFGIAPQDVCFAAFAGWDAAGAAWFGYRTVWVNRLGFPAEELGEADAIVAGPSLDSLVAWARTR